MRVEITLEQTRRVSMEFVVTKEELKMLQNGENPFEDELMMDIDSAFVEYDYAVNDMEGRTLVDWS